MGFRRALWWISLAVFLSSAAWVGVYAYQAYFGARTLGQLAVEVAQARASGESGAATAVQEAPGTGESASKAPGADPAAAQQAPGTGESASAPDEIAAARQDGRDAAAEGQADALLGAYQALARRNPDMIGWVHIEGTPVDYPVMHTPGAPEKYLHRDFDGKYSFAGLPFLDAQCDPDARSENLILYAHNMRTGQMFAQLTQYLDGDFLEAHPSVQFDTLTARGAYQVIAVLRLRAEGRQQPSMLCYRTTDTTLPQAADDWNAYLDRYASVRAGDVRPGDGILTLSTCEHADSLDRLVVVARRGADPA